MSTARPGRTGIEPPKHRGPGVGESPPGCGGGCLGCLGVAAVVLVAAALLVEGKRTAHWNGFFEGMDELQPGMTEEEVRALFPSNFLFETENTDDFGCHTWVPDAEAVPTRMLRVAPGEREEEGEEGTGKRGETEGKASAGEDFRAHLYFDGDGRLVGVQEHARKGRFWQRMREVWSGGRVRGEHGEEEGDMGEE